MMPKTTSQRRQRQKDAKNGAKTIQNGPKTIQNDQKTIGKHSENDPGRAIEPGQGGGPKRWRRLAVAPRSEISLLISQMSYRAKNPQKIEKSRE